MILLPKDEMDVNKFVYVQLPTKAEIFSRTGQRAVSPSGVFTGDESAVISKSPTDQAEAFVKAAEAYQKEVPSEDGK